MNKLITNTALKAIAWRMKIAWFFFFSGVSLAGALVTALTNTTWSTIDTQGKVLICLSVFITWGNTMMAFFSNTTKDIQTEIDQEASSTINTSSGTQSLSA